MSLVEILPGVHSLSRVEKMRLIQVLAQELEHDESDLIEPERSYEVGAPDREFAAAEVMMQALDEDRRLS